MLFRQNVFVSMPKKFVGERFRVSLISGIEKLFCLRGLGTNFGYQ